MATAAATAPSPPPADRSRFGSPVPDETLFKVESYDRSIPLNTGDLARLLMSEPGLSPDDRDHLSDFLRLLGSILHYEFHVWLDDLKELYAPIDPDSECTFLDGHSRPRTEQVDEQFLGPFEVALIRANYQPLAFHVLEHAIETPNEMGLNYVPDFDSFEHLRVYVRGATKVTRKIRNIATRFRKKEIVFDGYRRVVIALKFRQGAKRLKDTYVNTNVLYLRMFKDVPFVDMEMHLPEQGTRVRMRKVDKAQIASPLLVGIPMFLMKLVGATLLGGGAGLFALPLGSLAAIMAAPFTASMNSFFGFQRKKQEHLHRMIRHLYYLTLANNSSVINRLIDSAEEEEFKEALLAFAFLAQHPHEREPWTAKRLDRAIEAYLKTHAGLTLDFDVADALVKLLRLGLVRQDVMGRLDAATFAESVEILRNRWMGHFDPATPTDEPAVGHHSDAKAQSEVAEAAAVAEASDRAAEFDDQDDEEDLEDEDVPDLAN